MKAELSRLLIQACVKLWCKQVFAIRVLFSCADVWTPWRRWFIQPSYNSENTVIKMFIGGGQLKSQPVQNSEL